MMKTRAIQFPINTKTTYVTRDGVKTAAIRRTQNRQTQWRALFENGMTEDVFDSGRTWNGTSGYDLVAEVIPDVVKNNVDKVNVVAPVVYKTEAELEKLKEDLYTYVNIVLEETHKLNQRIKSLEAELEAK